MTLVMVCPAMSAQSAGPTPVYRWTTVAGRASLGAEDGPATAARFNNPHGLALDLAGNLFVADTRNHTIRRISSNGVVTTFAGSTGQAGSIDGPGVTARFNAPEGLAVDASGNLYVADTGNHTIRKITPAGVVTTLAGQAGVKGTADGPASAALFDAPSRLNVDANGTVYLSNHGVRKISGGQVQTLNLPTQAMDQNGQSQAVYVGAGPAVDAAGQLYFRGTLAARSYLFNQCILKLDAAGNLTVTLDPGYSEVLGWGDYGIFNDVAGNLYVTHSYRGFGGTPGYYEGRGLQAGGTGTTVNPGVQFIGSDGGIDDPQGVAVDHRTGGWYYTRNSDDAIMGGTGTYAGTPRSTDAHDGSGPGARIEDARALTIDSAGSLWFADLDQRYPAGEPASSFGLRKVSLAGNVQTIIPPPHYPERFYGQYPGLAADGAGKIYFSRYTNWIHLFSQLDAASGTISPLPAEKEGFYLTGLAANPAGTILATVQGRDRVYRREPDGTWTDIAGGSSALNLSEGTGTGVRFGSLAALAADLQGNFYVLDVWDAVPGDGAAGRCYVRQVSPNGAVATRSGDVARKNAIDGSTTRPASLAIDSQGTFYLAYPESNTIRRITRGGEETVIGASPGMDGSLDGIGGVARFARPNSLSIDRQDNLYFIDGYGTTLRKGEFLGYTPGLATQPQSATVTAGGTAQFAVTASGTPTPTYQWYLGNTALSGATSNTVTLANVRTSDAGDYTVVVTNSLGSVTSAKATLTVTAAQVTPPPPVSTGGGGGGAPSHWFMLALLVLSATRLARRAVYPRANA